MTLTCENSLSLENIRRSRRERLTAVVLTAYGDESSDATNQRTFSIAAVVGSHETWDALTPKWHEATGGIVFHAADCEAGYNDFSGMSLPDRLKLIRRLASLLATSGLIGHASVIDLKAHRLFATSFRDDLPYLHAFSEVITQCAEVGYLSIPREPVSFILDRNLGREYNAVHLYYEVMQKRNEILAGGGVSFKTRDEMGIQAADLFAREAMKSMDSWNSGAGRPVSTEAFSLLTGAPKRFYVRTMGHAYFKQARHLADKFANNPGPYRDWLSRKRLVDNTTNRLDYLAIKEGIPPSTGPKRQGPTKQKHKHKRKP
jgi:hypothetical protein